MQNPLFFFEHALMIVITKAKIELKLNRKKICKELIEHSTKTGKRIILSYKLTNSNALFGC